MHGLKLYLVTHHWSRGNRVFGSNLSKIPSRTEFTNIVCTSLDKKFCNFEYCHLKSVNRSYKYFSVKMRLLKIPVTKVKINLGLYQRFSGYRPFLYDVTIDACRFLKNETYNPVANYFYELIRDHSNMNHTCPFDHDLIVEKVTTEFMNHRPKNVLPFAKGDYLMEVNWIGYDINRALTKLYFTLS
ncbi:uncharacterized protein LOC111072977 [Drosophila obscura]|uniref:uncharacterized protein LOC111072977 n=1 Tax=Drosophila obscura TaxID=7282 RepID=UPI000B9FC895|nr:uncharacterized protein LOC111072977 [Drosophila obscura]